MQRNEYRRALIMLRSLMNGYSGHARIEIRTLTGNLNIRAAIPQGAQSVRAALVGKRSALYYAYPLGNLRRDMRGQAGLSVNFDPRDIGGRTLDAYSLLALVTINDGVCELALVGNLNGSSENDWSRVRDVVCALFAPQPRPEEPPVQTPYSLRPETAAQETEAWDAVEPEAAVQEPEADVQEPETWDTAEPEAAAQEQEQPDSADETNDEGLVWDLSQPDEGEEPDNGGEPDDGVEMSDGKEPVTDEDGEDVPGIFSREGWSFVKIPLPESCGYAFAYVGTPECGGEACVALPAEFTPEPPIGLDDYAWSGGLGSGYWVKCFAMGESDT